MIFDEKRLANERDGSHCKSFDYTVKNYLFESF